jgi:hypothetical protein
VRVDVHDGDVIEIPSNKVDQPPRRGTVMEVVREEPLTLEVEWDDGHTSRLQPAGGTLRVLDDSA